MNGIVGFVGLALILSPLASNAVVEPDAQALEFHLESDSVYEAFEEAVDANVEHLLLKVFVVIDFSLYKKWLSLERNDENTAIANIRYFYAHLIEEISKRYSSIDTGPYRYKCALSGYYIIQTPKESYFTESEDVKTSNPEKLHFSTVLKKLKRWVAEKADVIKSIGVVAAFTTYADVDAAGLAYVGTACTDRGVSITQSGTLYTTVGLAAHEIGHNIGSHHDGNGNDCNRKDLYIMTPTQRPSNFSKYHTFSPCSRNYFEKYVNSLDSTLKEKCFKNEKTPLDDEVKKYLSVLPGERYTADQSCQHYYGTKSYNCLRGMNAHVSICQSSTCYNPKDGRCYSFSDLRALDGTPCGNKTWCLNKKCVYDERAPVNDGRCLFGDRKEGLTFNNKPYLCPDLLKEPDLCRHDFFSEICCKTCTDLKGKKSSDDSKDDCKDKNRKIKYDDKIITCAYFRSNPEYCENKSLRRICCQTCKKVSAT